jgi:hypothetical protein
MHGINGIRAMNERAAHEARLQAERKRIEAEAIRQENARFAAEAKPAQEVDILKQQAA